MRTIRIVACAGVIAATAAGVRSAAMTVATAPQGTVTTCDAANPFDNTPDDAALQACLDNFEWVLLKPANLRSLQPGYQSFAFDFGSACR